MWLRIAFSVLKSNLQFAYVHSMADLVPPSLVIVDALPIAKRSRRQIPSVEVSEREDYWKKTLGRNEAVSQTRRKIVGL